MARYIDADKFAERIKASPVFPNMGQDGYFIQEFILDLIDRQIANATPRSEGEWFDKGSLSCRCSRCGGKSNKESRFCPNCGAKMKGGI